MQNNSTPLKGNAQKMCNFWKRQKHHEVQLTQTTPKADL